MKRRCQSKALILYVNPAFERITGYSREEVLGRNPRLLQSGEHDAAFYRGLWRTLGAGQIGRGRFIFAILSHVELARRAAEPDSKLGQRLDACPGWPSAAVYD